MDKIFSGKNSEKLWEKINQVKMTSPERYDFPDIVWEALYALGCKCQELESLLPEASTRPNDAGENCFYKGGHGCQNVRLDVAWKEKP